MMTEKKEVMNLKDELKKGQAFIGVDDNKYYVSPDKIECVNMKLNFTENEVSENCWEPLSVVLAKAGSINPERLFRTEAEAQAEMHELNKELLGRADG